MTAPDALLADLRAALDEAEGLAQRATEGPWRVEHSEHCANEVWGNDYPTGAEQSAQAVASAWAHLDHLHDGDYTREETNAAHIAARDPLWTLRLIAAERETLARHRPYTQWYGDSDRYCRSCHTDEGDAVAWPCPDVLARAHVWLPGEGITEDEVKQP